MKINPRTITPLILPLPDPRHMLSPRTGEALQPQVTRLACLTVGHCRHTPGVHADNAARNARSRRVSLCGMRIEMLSVVKDEN